MAVVASGADCGYALSLCQCWYYQ